MMQVLSFFMVGVVEGVERRWSNDNCWWLPEKRIASTVRIDLASMLVLPNLVVFVVFLGGASGGKLAFDLRSWSSYLLNVGPSMSILLKSGFS